MHSFPKGFLWGAASAPHQVEGGNVNSDFWAQEPPMHGADLSGDALDSYHRYPEDTRLVADAGLNTYRFGIEWARIEPTPGQISRAQLAYYRADGGVGSHRVAGAVVDELEDHALAADCEDVLGRV